MTKMVAFELGSEFGLVHAPWSWLLVCPAFVHMDCQEGMPYEKAGDPRTTVTVKTAGDVECGECLGVRRVIPSSTSVHEF
jgi:hypothetical protein